VFLKLWSADQEGREEIYIYGGAWEWHGLGEIARSSPDHRRDLPMDGFSCASRPRARSLRPVYSENSH